ncbi:Sodium/calcium exchanger protein-domain-containing protein [Vararia minispora EC-137]|uniref:Sodium/calcium exchanger protein-domain-containing protein n=1 Tax=Vararia minispora EC-137 TaxID=1314806 RepID=A0ACB8QHP1_9AGAM|nr:Sodium/calcium exchanger protein-domain-containing protein [Vararia minispora EC-137]
MSSESTPLLANGSHPPSFAHRAVTILKSEGEPSWAHSFRYFLCSSYVNIFLLLVPLSACAHYLGWDAAVRFSISFLAIIPLAKLLGDATEQMAMSLGQTLAGLLNATFGNAVEIIVGVTALLQDQIHIVKASMLGSILSNILLVLGCSFLAGGLVQPESSFRVTAAQTNASLMTLACITLVIPAAYHSAQAKIGGDFVQPTPVEPGIVSALGASIDNDDHITDMDPAAMDGLLIISRGTALLLLGVYVCYLIFQLKTHQKLFEARARTKRQPTLGFSSCPSSPALPPAVTLPGEEPPKEEGEVAQMNMLSAGVALFVVTVITAFVADFLVAAIEGTAKRYNIPKAFIGLILLPLVANAAEHVTSVWMAMKNKMELTISVCVGSSIQLATFVVPLLVTIGWISGHELTLFFNNFETVVFFVSVMLVNMLIQDGKSNYMEGVMLLALYFVIALAFWVS